MLVCNQPILPMGILDPDTPIWGVEELIPMMFDISDRDSLPADLKCPTHKQV
jgi:hypothetical protein